LNGAVCERGSCLGPDDPIDLDARRLLQFADSMFGCRAVLAVERTRIETECGEPLLHPEHVGPCEERARDEQQAIHCLNSVTDDVKWQHRLLENV
jgi:hypothetical protein